MAPKDQNVPNDFDQNSQIEKKPRKKVKKDLTDDSNSSLNSPSSHADEETPVERQKQTTQESSFSDFSGLNFCERETEQRTMLPVIEKKNSLNSFDFNIEELYQKGKEFMMKKGNKKCLTQKFFKETLGITKEEFSKKYKIKGKKDQLTKTLQQTTNRKINDLCGLNFTRQENDRKIWSKKFVETIFKKKLEAQVRDKMRDIIAFMKEFFSKKTPSFETSAKTFVNDLHYEIMQTYIILSVKQSLFENHDSKENIFQPQYAEKDEGKQENIYEEEENEDLLNQLMFSGR